MKYIIIYEKFAFADGYYGSAYVTEFEKQTFNSKEDAINFLKNNSWSETGNNLMYESTAMVMEVGSELKCVYKMYKNSIK